MMETPDFNRLHCSSSDIHLLGTSSNCNKQLSGETAITFQPSFYDLLPHKDSSSCEPDDSFRYQNKPMEGACHNSDVSLVCLRENNAVLEGENRLNKFNQSTSEVSASHDGHNATDDPFNCDDDNSINDVCGADVSNGESTSVDDMSTSAPQFIENKGCVDDEVIVLRVWDDDGKAGAMSSGSEDGSDDSLYVELTDDESSVRNEKYNENKDSMVLSESSELKHCATRSAGSVGLPITDNAEIARVPQAGSMEFEDCGVDVSNSDSLFHTTRSEPHCQSSGNAECALTDLFQKDDVSNVVQQLTNSASVVSVGVSTELVQVTSKENGFLSATCESVAPINVDIINHALTSNECKTKKLELSSGVTDTTKSTESSFDFPMSNDLVTSSNVSSVCIDLVTSSNVSSVCIGVDYSVIPRQSVATTATMPSICGPAAVSRYTNTDQDSHSLNVGNDTSSMVESGIAPDGNYPINYHQITTVGSSIVSKSSCIGSQLSITPQLRSPYRSEGDTCGKSSALRAVSVVNNDCATVGIEQVTSNTRTTAVGTHSITAIRGEHSVSVPGGKQVEEQVDNLTDFLPNSPHMPHQSESTVSYGGPSELVSPNVIAVQQSKSKRKLASSSDYVPIKKEKQDDGYERPPVNGSIQPVNLGSGLLPAGFTATSDYVHGDLLSSSLPIVDQSVQHDGFRKATVWWPTNQKNARNPSSDSRTSRTDTVVSTVLATAVTQFTDIRHQSSQPTLTMAPSSRSSRKLPTVVSVSNKRQRTNHSSASPSASIILALSRKVKSHIGKSFGERYVAPMHAPPELCLPPPRRYICSGCGNEYITLAGMQSHLSRQSMVLTFKCKCNVQKWPQTFYNPCSLASFYKAHKRRPGHHVALDTFIASVLKTDTPEYLQLCEVKKQRLEAAASVSVVVGSQVQEKPVKKARKSRSRPNKIEDDSQLNGRKESMVEGAVSDAKNSSKSVASAGTSTGACTQKACTLPKTAVVAVATKEATNMEITRFFDAFMKCKTSCMECGAFYMSRRGLAKHFTSPNLRTNSTSACSDTYVCSKCSVSLPTKCSFEAHLRLHDRRKPYVCPECGLLFDEVESFEIFNRHVERSCLHSARVPVPHNTCTRCQFTLSTGNAKDLASHMVDSHTVTYRKCQACPMAFATAVAAERHSMNTGHNAQHRVVRKCPSCDAVFESTSSLDIYSHVQDHLTSLQFQCQFCSTRHSSSLQVLEHIKSSHSDDVLSLDTCEICGESFSSRKPYYDHVFSSHPELYKSVLSKSSVKVAALLQMRTVAQAVNEDKSAYDCARCQMHFDKKELYKRHLAKHRFLENKKESKQKNRNDDSSPKSTVFQTQQVSVQTSVGHVSCSLCERLFPDTTKLDEHKAADHGLTKYHVCYLCADCFVDADALRQHMVSRHTGKARMHAFVCPICAESSDSMPRSFPHQGLLTKHLHTAHRFPREEAANRAKAAMLGANVDVVSRSTPGTPSDTVSVARRLYVKGQTESYLCAQCHFSNEDRNVFNAHVIAAHPVEPVDAVQCMECSQCFPVAPALQRHLRLVHRITDRIEDYLTKNGISSVVTDEKATSHTIKDVVKSSKPPTACTPTNVPKLESSPNSNCSPMECTVCYRLFFSIDQLRTHMRVHGMAFIQGTRRKQSNSPR